MVKKARTVRPTVQRTKRAGASNEHLPLVRIVRNTVQPVLRKGVQLNLSYFNALLAIIIAGSVGRNPSSLAAEQNATRQAMTRGIDRLVVLGYVRRTKRQGNQNLVHIIATRKGRRFGTSVAQNLLRAMLTETPQPRRSSTRHTRTT